MFHLENHLWYTEFSEGFLILDPPCQEMLQLGILPGQLLMRGSISYN